MRGGEELEGIPPGGVITDDAARSNGAAPYQVLDLFSGIGGFALGLERSGGFAPAAFCEIEPYARRVLARHWPKVPCYDDVRTLSAACLARDGISVNAISGGFPCQDVSLAGPRAGIGGERSGLWSEYARLIGELRPEVVIVENTPGLLSAGFGRVLSDLAALGYSAWWDCIPACHLGANHERDRLWVVAYDGSKQHEGYSDALRRQIAARLHQAAADAYQTRLEIEFDGETRQFPPLVGARQWAVEPDVVRVVYGLRDRVHRLKALGNAVVPQIPELIGRAILQARSAA
jgi:DNA (cytosine-5)-methyltransferase 1